MRPNDPLRQYRFRLEIDGIDVAAFQSVTGLDVQIQMAEYREGTDKGGVRKLPAFPRFESNLVLSRGQTQVNSAFWIWFRDLSQGKIERRDGSVVLCDEAGTDRIRWDWEAGWLCKLTGAELDAASNEVAVQRAEICYERLSATYLG